MAVMATRSTEGQQWGYWGEFPGTKISENMPKRSARRAHKRQLANVIIRHMWRDAEHRPAQPPSHAAAWQESFESVNARIRKAVRARGHFPNEQAALKCVYMAIMSPDRTGQGRKRWSQRWKAALNAFEIAFDGRLSAARR
ncbi:hypothetical protein GCM10023080_091590 [Streptomyces pseudoechinosporeus]